MIKVLATLIRVDASSTSVFPNLVIYHELRDFGHGPRDYFLLLVTSHESPKVRDFGKFPRKMGKSHYFAQKLPKNFGILKKIRDFPAILWFFARDFRDFLGVFLLVIFVTFLA